MLHRTKLESLDYVVVGEWEYKYKYILADIPAVVLIIGDLNSHLEFSMEPFNPQ